MNTAVRRASWCLVVILLTALWAESSWAGGPGFARRNRYLSRCDGDGLAFDGCVPDPNEQPVCVPKVTRNAVCEPLATAAECAFSQNNTIAAQIRFEIDDEPCDGIGSGAMLKASMRVRRGDGTVYDTAEEVADLCNFQIPDCSASDNPFLCGDQAGFFNESNPPQPEWFNLQPVLFNLGDSGLQGTPIFGPATLLGSEDHSQDRLPTVVRFCVKISGFNLPTSCPCDCTQYPDDCCTSVPECCAYICSDACTDACAATPASCESYPSCACPISQFLARPF